MRIAFLCKRKYMSKDVIVDRYARLYEIPRQLAWMGHDVLCFCLSYQGHASGRWEHEGGAGRLRWVSRSFKGKDFPAVLGYPIKVLNELREFRPDILIAASDIPHIVLGEWLSKKIGIPLVTDLYDNFEGFGQGRIPGFRYALRRSVRQSKLVTTTSAPLRDLVLEDYQAKGRVVAMPSAVDRSIFYPRSKDACRRKLGLPLEGKLIGTAGGLYREKGINQLYDAWRLLEEKFPDFHLVLAGPVEPETPIPVGERVHYLGLLPHSSVAEFFCALDVGVMCIPDTVFGRYCFPQKAYEMLACSLPVVATGVGAMLDVFSGDDRYIFRCDDVQDCVEKIVLQVEWQMLPDLEIMDWQGLIKEMESHMRSIVSG